MSATRPRNLWHRPRKQDENWRLGPVVAIDLTVPVTWSFPKIQRRPLGVLFVGSSTRWTRWEFLLGRLRLSVVVEGDNDGR